MSDESTEDQTEEKKGPDAVTKGCLMLAAVPVVLVAFLFLWAMVSPGDDDRDGYAEVACEDWVKEKLRSPSSAEFSGTEVTRSGDRYTVTGNVDSENGFGAMIRNTYTCAAEDNGDSMTLVSLTGLTN